MPVPAVRVNERTVLVSPDVPVGSPLAAAFGLYARASSHDQKSDLDRQVARLTGWAAEAGRTVVRVEAEVGSADERVAGESQAVVGRPEGDRGGGRAPGSVGADEY